MDVILLLHCPALPKKSLPPCFTTSNTNGCVHIHTSERYIGVFFLSFLFFCTDFTQISFSVRLPVSLGDIKTGSRIPPVLPEPRSACTPVQQLARAYQMWQMCRMSVTSVLLVIDEHSEGFTAQTCCGRAPREIFNWICY